MANLIKTEKLDFEPVRNTPTTTIMYSYNAGLSNALPDFHLMTLYIKNYLFPTKSPMP